jgi:hypothetical protein
MTGAEDTRRGRESESALSASTLLDDPFASLPPLPTDPSLTPSIFDDFLSFASSPGFADNHEEPALTAGDAENAHKLAHTEKAASAASPGKRARYEGR